MHKGWGGGGEKVLLPIISLGTWAKLCLWQISLESHLGKYLKVIPRLLSSFLLTWLSLHSRGTKSATDYITVSFSLFPCWKGGKMILYTCTTFSVSLKSKSSDCCKFVRITVFEEEGDS